MEFGGILFAKHRFYLEDFAVMEMADAPHFIRQILRPHSQLPGHGAQLYIFDDGLRFDPHPKRGQRA